MLYTIEQMKPLLNEIEQQQKTLEQLTTVAFELAFFSRSILEGHKPQPVTIPTLKSAGYALELKKIVKSVCDAFPTVQRQGNILRFVG